MISGAQSFPRSLVMSAPIMARGVMILFIGRLHMESSPITLEEKFWAARIPDISLVVVPLFPTSRVSAGALRPWSPFPWIVTMLPS